ncbi:MAG: 30S ribosomal protein S6 [Candidatus Pelagibacter sp. TMED263]|nr:MAG: 30S ribosomal protein S6 [Candidatus Pelagibacter sp. TMED263]|tara:strand:- start:514 stop:837 length:324 start_codon:yes stop_codon:yes gene_type:complete
MSFYENTLVAKQDLPKSELDKIKEKYSSIINNNSGKVIKIEEWGLLNLARKIKRYKKGFYIHYKFEGNKETLTEIIKKIKIDPSVIRHLVVKYKNLDTKNEYFKSQK